MKRRCTLTLVAVFGLCGGGLPHAQAQSNQEFYPLKDVYAVICRSQTDGGTEVELILSGPSTAIIFDQMRATVLSARRADGTIKQHARGIQRARTKDGSTQCSFGYAFQTQNLTPGPLIY